MPPKKRVQIRDALDVKEYNNQSPKSLMTEIVFVKDVLIKFLRSPVEDILYTAGSHYSSLVKTKGKPIETHYPPVELSDDVNHHMVVRQFVSAMHKYMLPDKNPNDDASKEFIKIVNTYLKEILSKKQLVADVFKTYLEIAKHNNTSEDDKKKIEFACLVLLRLGLYSFFKFNQCQNKCNTVMQYKGNLIVPPKTTVSNRNYRDIYGTCLLAHGQINNELGISANDFHKITIFNDLLLKASDNKCSLLRVINPFQDPTTDS